MVSGERKSILLVTLSNIGDVILTTPVLGSVRAAFPKARLTVVVGPRPAPLLQGSHQMDRVLIYDKTGGWSHKLSLLRSLREEFYDYVIDLRNSAIPFLVRAERRSPVFRFSPHREARENHLEILRRMKLPFWEDARFDFYSPEEESSLQKKLEMKTGGIPAKGLVVAPGAASEAKRWPAEKFREALIFLSNQSSLPLFVVGDEREKGLGAYLSERAPERIFNLAGELSLRELAALVAQAALVLTNDSASMHLAYELHRPVVALFGPSDPERYGRQNAIWRILHEPPPRGLRALPSERVIRACLELLKTPHVGSS